jgi:hypothetical protein
MLHCLTLLLIDNTLTPRQSYLTSTSQQVSDRIVTHWSVLPCDLPLLPVAWILASRNSGVMTGIITSLRTLLNNNRSSKVPVYISRDREEKMWWVRLTGGAISPVTNLFSSVEERGKKRNSYSRVHGQGFEVIMSQRQNCTFYTVTLLSNRIDLWPL